MKKISSMLFGLSLFLGSFSLANAEVSSDVMDVINKGNLNNIQHKAIVQYAESLVSILNVDTNNRDAIIAVNKEFMNAQQCLAEVYGIDQQPNMMRVSRNVYRKTFAQTDDLKKYHEFLGQAQQEGDLAIPSPAKACKK
ncbi:MAG: hypothetical protein ACI4V7_06710 [Succinivibrionaceae bacterium]